MELGPPARMKSGAGVTYTFDGAGQRVADSSPKLYWHGLNGSVLAETDTSGNTSNEYVFFGGMRVARRDSSGNVYYYFGNALGSSAITTATGSVCYDADFYPFGWELAFTNTCGQNYKFAAMQRDTSSGLDRTLFRQYSSNNGRWLSPDPLGKGAASLVNPQTWNLYAYVINNPTNLVDPAGMDGCDLNGADVDGDVNCDAPQGPTAPDCYDGPLCGTQDDGVPMLYDASYNPTTAPDWMYLQALLSWQQMDTWIGAVTLSQGAGYVEYTPLPTGASNSVNDGYQGNGEFDLGFEMEIWQLEQDATNNHLGDISQILSEWQENYQGRNGYLIPGNNLTFLPISSPVTSCSTQAGQVYSSWNQMLQAWIKAHPGQQPPPGLATPPSMWCGI